MRIKHRKRAIGQKFMLQGRHKPRVAEITARLYQDWAFGESFLILETHEKNLPPPPSPCLSVWFLLACWK